MNSTKTGILGLYRHGTAEAHNSRKFQEDDLRPLTEEGRKTVLQCGLGLRHLGFLPDEVHASHALRARQTAEALIQALELAPQVLRINAALHLDIDPHAALKRMDYPKAGKRILWIGHEPWLGEAIGILTGGVPLPLRKAGFAMLGMGKNRKQNAQLIAFLPPEYLVSLKSAPAKKRFIP